MNSATLKRRLHPTPEVPRRLTLEDRERDPATFYRTMHEDWMALKNGASQIVERVEAFLPAFEGNSASMP